MSASLNTLISFLSIVSVYYPVTLSIRSKSDVCMVQVGRRSLILSRSRIINALAITSAVIQALIRQAGIKVGGMAVYFMVTGIRLAPKLPALLENLPAILLSHTGQCPCSVR